MISASVYITVCSAKNRLRQRLARLREPRYLVGAVVGAAYLYFSFFARGRARAGRSRRGAPPGAVAAGVAALAAVGPAIVGVGLLVLGTLAWALPFDSGLLDFSDAETDLLFPAPVTRHALLIHRLIRSQAGILFGAVIVGLVSPAPGWMRFRMLIAAWLLLVTIRVYFTGVTLARTQARAGASRLALWTPLAGAIAAIAVVGTALTRAFRAAPVAGAIDAFGRAAAATSHGPAAVALWPTAALGRPFFATSVSEFLTSMAGGLAVGIAALWWMLRSDEAFQEAASDAALRRIEKAQGRQGGLVRARTTGLSLGLAGPTEFAFFWKNGVQTLRLTGVTAIRIAVAAIAVSVALSSIVLNTMQLRGGAAVAFAVAMAVAAFAATLGPQVIRTDLRTDLLHLDVLKTWPVRPAAVVRGEIAWPAAMLTAIGWIAIGCASVFSPAAFPHVRAATRVSVALAALLLMPALVSAQYLVQNAAALAFPAWVPLGNQRPRGVDAMGQRIIMLGGALLSVVVMFVPGAIAGGAVWLALQQWIGSLAVVPASLVCTAIVLLEVLAATELLSPLYERLDLLAVERGE